MEAKKAEDYIGKRTHAFKSLPALQLHNFNHVFPAQGSPLANANQETITALQMHTTLQPPPDFIVMSNDEPSWERWDLSSKMSEPCWLVGRRSRKQRRNDFATRNSRLQHIPTISLIQIKSWINQRDTFYMKTRLLWATDRYVIWGGGWCINSELFHWAKQELFPRQMIKDFYLECTGKGHFQTVQRFGLSLDIRNNNNNNNTGNC